MKPITFFLLIHSALLFAQTPAPLLPATDYVPAMRFIQGGTFRMGDSTSDDSDEKPVHSVTVSDFYLCESEVTVAQFRAFADASGYSKQLAAAAKSFLDTVKNDQLPMIYVSWFDAWNMCFWLKETTGIAYRLPTEAEWEYAAGGGSAASTSLSDPKSPRSLSAVGERSRTNVEGNNGAAGSRRTLYAGTNSETDLQDYAWFSANSNSTTHTVKTKKPNELGIYDMSGNVWEWCWDVYGNYTSEAQVNPTGPAEGSYRVLRGGSWSFYAANVRVANRINDGPYNKDNDVGFRLTRTP